MSLIISGDDHAAFFPIDLDNNLADGNNPDGSVAASANNNSDFQIRLQALIDRPTDNGVNPQDNSIPNETGEPVAPVSEVNNKDMLGSFLDQNTDNFEISSSAEPIANMPYGRMITKYKQAMHDFRNAFKLPAPGTPDGLNIDPLNRIGDEDSGVIPNIGNPGTSGVNPGKEQISAYITEQCQQIGLPAQLGLATAMTESDLTQFDKNGAPYRNSNPDSTDWGIMQINDKAWGERFDFNRIKSDWKYNIRAGLQVLKTCFDAALNNNEASKGDNASFQNLARAAYSGYNAGVANLWRYRTPITNAAKTASYDVINNEGYDLRDIRFWNNYQKFS